MNGSAVVERSLVSRPTSRLVFWSMAALVLWSFALRIWFASYDLHPGRFHDERFNVENLHGLVVEGRLRPANGWYPSLSYLPQAPLLAAGEWLHRTTGEERFALFVNGGFTPAAYLLCRSTVAVFGALTLLLTFQVGRRLFDPAVGLFGAVILAASPTHLRLSVVFKPDMLLLLLTLVVFLLTLRVADRATFSRWLAAGAGVGLATAAKLVGPLTALPLTGVAGVKAVRGRTMRPLVGLAAAGLLAGAVFLALNPHVGVQLDYLGRIVRVYSERAELADLDRTAALRSSVTHLLSPGFHGLWIGLLALAGTLAAAGSAIRRSSRPSSEPPAQPAEDTPGRSWFDFPRPFGRPHPWHGLLPLFVFGYGLFYATTTAYPKPNNLLPLLPFTSLAAAWLVVAAGRAVAPAIAGAVRRLGPAPAARGREKDKLVGWVASALGIGLAAVMLVPLQSYAYYAAVPPTWGRIERVLDRELRPYAGRMVIYEQHDGEPTVKLLDRREAVAVRGIEEPSEATAEERRLADAEVFATPAELKAGSAAESAAESSTTARILRFEPRLGRAWGPSLGLALHPWRLLDRRRSWAEQTAPRRWVLPLPESLREPEPAPASEPPPEGPGTASAVLSVQVLVRAPEPPPEPPRLEVAGRSLPLHSTRVETGGYVYGTAYTCVRFTRKPGEEVTVSFRPGAPDAARPPVADVLVWAPPERGGSG